MGAPVDIAGQRFGRLVAVRVAQSKPRKWLCRCDCGNDTVVLTRDLRNGNTTSCGCRKTDYEDLTGERFGKLGDLRAVGCVDRGVAADLVELHFRFLSSSLSMQSL